MPQRGMTPALSWHVATGTSASNDAAWRDSELQLIFCSMPTTAAATIEPRAEMKHLGAIKLQYTLCTIRTISPNPPTRRYMPSKKKAYLTVDIMATPANA